MKRIILLGWLVILPKLAWAGETAAFLKIGVGARPLGLGGAYTAVGNDVSAMAWNPAGLGGLSRRELGVMHAELVESTRYDFLGYAQPTKFGILGAGAGYLSQGSIQGRDEAGHPTGGFAASDSVVNLSYATKPLASNTKLGMSVKMLHSRIANASAYGCAFDLGLQRDLGLLGAGVPMLGFSVQNLGPGMKFADEIDPLPLTLAAGLGYRLPIGLTMALDYKNRPHERSSEVSIGTEYAIFSSFALRAGYASAAAQSKGRGGLSAMSGFAAGFGFKLYSYNIDYSMTPLGELGNVQRLSLGARF
ncbi:MAG TPA: hypothetical protein DEB40_00885 [Elusimicrobia bacterium]|nr:hypothetical protein [Elusimicrobiota bacterium]HBT60284.1 hypothetical protein [Elusimicrobiota bacterium]